MKLFYIARAMKILWSLPIFLFMHPSTLLFVLSVLVLNALDQALE